MTLKPSFAKCIILIPTSATRISKVVQARYYFCIHSFLSFDSPAKAQPILKLSIRIYVKGRERHGADHGLNQFSELEEPPRQAAGKEQHILSKLLNFQSRNKSANREKSTGLGTCFLLFSNFNSGRRQTCIGMCLRRADWQQEKLWSVTLRWPTQGELGWPFVDVVRKV